MEDKLETTIGAIHQLTAKLLCLPERMQSQED